MYKLYKYILKIENLQSFRMKYAPYLKFLSTIGLRSLKIMKRCNSKSKILAKMKKKITFDIIFHIK